MPKISVIQRDGEIRFIDAPVGFSLMEAIRDGGVDEMTAICGGGCSCATCHVIVEAEHLHRLPPLGDDEDAMLDAAPDRGALSRLSCQIPVTEELDGLTVTLGAE